MLIKKEKKEEKGKSFTGFHTYPFLTKQKNSTFKWEIWNIKVEGEKNVKEEIYSFFPENNTHCIECKSIFERSKCSPFLDAKKGTNEK